MKGETHISIGAAVGVIWKPTSVQMLPCILNLSNPHFAKPIAAAVAVLVTKRVVPREAKQSRTIAFSMS